MEDTRLREPLPALTRVPKAINWTVDEYVAIQALMKIFETANYSEVLRIAVADLADKHEVRFPRPPSRRAS